MNRQARDWKRFRGEELPAVLDLFPVFYDVMKTGHLILDIGCGPGRTCGMMRDAGYTRVLGLDINEEGVRRAARLFGSGAYDESAPSFVAADAARIPFHAHSVDGVVVQAVLTTLYRDDTRRAVVSEMARVLKRPGWAYLAVFGQTWEQPVYRRRYEEGLEQGYERGAFVVTDPDTGERLFVARHFTHKEVADLLRDFGFEVVRYSSEQFNTRTGSRINGHVFAARMG